MTNVYPAQLRPVSGQIRTFAKSLQKLHHSFTEILNIKVVFYFELKNFFDNVRTSTVRIKNARSTFSTFAENTCLITCTRILFNLNLLLYQGLEFNSLGSYFA